MTLAIDLDYVAPTSLDEVLGLLATDAERHERDGHDGCDARAGRIALLAGGTDLVPWLRDGATRPELLVDLKRIPGLARLELADGALEVGCLVTFTDLLTSDAVGDRFPVLTEMAGMVASVGIRNRATVVGNLCSAVPSGDAGPLLLVLGAQVRVLGPAGQRTVPIERWFAGPRRTSLGPGEFVTGIVIPLPDAPHGAAFARLSRSRGEDLAQASVAVLVGPGPHLRVAFGAVAPTPVRARTIEALLADGLTADGELAGEALDRAVAAVASEIRPITDVRATERYRLRMSEVMLRRAVTAAVARAAGSGPAYGTRLL
jgi:CO/xanthine dehydrogenase FAD-binding subunit